MFASRRCTCALSLFVTTGVALVFGVTLIAGIAWLAVAIQVLSWAAAYYGLFGLSRRGARCSLFRGHESRSWNNHPREIVSARGKPTPHYRLSDTLPATSRCERRAPTTYLGGEPRFVLTGLTGAWSCRRRGIDHVSNPWAANHGGEPFGSISDWVRRGP